MMNLDEDVHVVASDPTWATKFLAERARIVAAPGDPDARLVHIGSTAVAGLCAKPIVDMMLGISTYPPAVRLTETITDLRYENLGEAGIPGRLYFRRRGTTSYNLHVVQYLGVHWKDNLLLRHYLAKSESARARYAAAKLEAVRAGATRLIAYSAAKAHIADDLLKEAAMQSDDSQERTREG